MATYWHPLNIHTLNRPIHFVESSIARSISRSNARSIARSQASYSKPWIYSNGDWVMRLFKFSLSFVWFNLVFLFLSVLTFLVWVVSDCILIYISSRFLLRACLYAMACPLSPPVHMWFMFMNTHILTIIEIPLIGMSIRYRIILSWDVVKSQNKTNFTRTYGFGFLTSGECPNWKFVVQPT